MRLIDADRIKEDFSDVLTRKFSDEYAKGYKSALIAVLGYETISSPPNSPLTLDELRKVEVFEWMWIELIHPSKRQLLHNIKSAYYLIFEDYTDGESLCCGWPGLVHEFEYEDYDKAWLAYRRKPEEGTT